MAKNSAATELLDRLSDWEWRIDNLYWITTKEGEVVRFRMKDAQRDFFRNMHYLNIILKARQHGFTTFIQIFMLDAALFNSNIQCGTIAHSLVAAGDIFRNTIKFAYDNLPDEIREAIPATSDSARLLSFANGSSIQVGTSLRSGTFQYVHVSEFGKICATRPDRAREIVTGTLNTIHAGQVGFIESTAEGNEGKFFEMCQSSQEKARRGDKLTALDWKFFFYPWWLEKEYTLDEPVVIIEIMRDYFLKLEVDHDIHLTDGQKAWYVKKEETQAEDMKREFPSFPDEAFEAAIDGAYYARQFLTIDEQGRILDLPHVPGLPVHTLWDLGMNDFMAIWLIQEVGEYNHHIDYYENSGEGLEHYFAWLQQRQRERGFIYGKHLWPHDGNVRILDEKGRQRTEVARDLGFKVEVVERNPSLGAGIETTRRYLATAKFCEVHCAQGIKHLRMYRKDWNEKLGDWRDSPRKGPERHGADALRTGAEGQKLLSRVPLAPVQANTNWSVFNG